VQVLLPQFELAPLQSGMHASTNIHIALKAKPPKRGVAGREVRRCKLLNR